MDQCTLPINLLQQIIADSIEIGYDKAMEDHNEATKVEVSKQWAYKKYSRKLVDRWIEIGIVKVYVHGGHDKLNRHELFKAHKTYNWHIHKIKIEKYSK